MSFLRKVSAQSSTTRNSTLLPGLADGEIGGARKPDHAAGAAQAEDRQALDVAAQAHALDQQRIQAGGGDAGGGDHHDGVDVCRA